MRRRLPSLLLLMLLLPTAARADEVLPDLDQATPFGVSAQFEPADSTYRLGFSSRVTNVGLGRLELDGSGSGVMGEPMAAAQSVELSEGGDASYPGVAQLNYVSFTSHEHWHITPFSRYILRGPAGDVLDEKTGFCLQAGYANANCGQNDPTLTSVQLGILPGLNDTYGAFIEGQYIVIDPVNVPSGEYVLVHETNWDGWLKEASLANNAASARIEIEWPPSPSSAAPEVAVLRECADSPACDAPAGPPPPPAPPPPAAPPPPPGPPPAPAPPPPPEGSTSPVRMSREAALELARAAVRRNFRRPGRIRTACVRRRTLAFSCVVAFRGGRGSVGLWYRVRGARIAWIYNLRAADVARLRVRGGARPVTAADVGPALFGRIPSG